VFVWLMVSDKLISLELEISFVIVL
jgi:hypothetical protein